MTARKIYTFRLNDTTPDDHPGRVGEITYRDGFLYYHDGVTPGGELINGGGGSGGTTTWTTLSGKPSFAAVATSGSYADLTGTPTIPTSFSSLVNGANTVSLGSTGILTLPNGAVIKDTAGYAVAFGLSAGYSNQGASSIAIGINAGYTDQGGSAVAIGYNAGYTDQGGSSVAIGIQAGYADQAANTIILNATGSAVNGVASQTSSFYVAPIRSATATANVLYYDTTTKEVTYGAGDGTFSGDYDDLTNKPTLFDGAYSSLTGTPALFSGSYTDLTSKPALFSGSYTDLTNKPTIPTSFSSLVNGAFTASLGTDGKLTAPGNLQVDGGKIILNSAGNAYVESVDYGVNSANSAVNIFGGPYQKIKLRAGFGTEATWTFDTSGDLTAPRNIILNNPVTTVTETETGTIADSNANPFTFRILKSANPQLVIPFADPNFVLKWTAGDAGSLAAAAQAPGGHGVSSLVSDDGTYWNFNSWYGLGGNRPNSGTVFTVEYGVVDSDTMISTTATNLIIEADTEQWKFGTDGALTLPSGGTISEGGGLTGAIRLTPAGGANEYQALVIYPTAGDGDHIHLTAGGGTTDLYLGSDLQYVQIQHSGHVVVQAADGVDNSQWLFNKNGDLTLPAGGDIKDSNGASVLGGSGSYAPAVPANWASPAPTTIAEALNRIAAKLLTLGGDLP